MITTGFETKLGLFLGTLFASMTFGPHLIAYLFYLLLLMVAADIITGWGKGMYNGNLNSAKNHRGYIRKATILLLAVLWIAIDFVVSYVMLSIGMDDFTAFGFSIVEVPLLSGIMLVYYIIGEFLSVAENLEAMGAPIPSFIKRIIKTTQQRIDEGDLDIKVNTKTGKDGKKELEVKIKKPSDEE